MSLKQKVLILGITFLLFPFVSFYLYFNWGYLPFQNYDYGKSYNDEREVIGQPIIEEYFFDKNPDWERRKVWLTPDSLKRNHLHFSKLYWTEKGEIIYEIDNYKPLEEVLFDTVLVRTYHYVIDSVGYKLSARKGRTSILDQEINRIQFDSIKEAWSNKLKDNR